MAIIPASPQSIWECAIVSVLREKSTPEGGAVEKVAAFVQTATPLVDLIISGPFKEYTLHNRDHAKKILHLAGHLIPATTLENLSPLEHLIVIYSAYLHDMGMCLTETERNRLLSSEEFEDSIQEWQELWDILSTARKAVQSASGTERFLLERKIFEIQEAALAAYLRPRHAEPLRYRQLINTLRIQSNRADLFQYGGVSFEDQLIDVCVSHNLDASTLAEVRGPYDERFPRKLALGGAYLNSQFCAALLRLADILDFDRERTPRILFESLGISERTIPGAELTIREWQKHMAVHTIELNEDEIVVSADSEHPVIEKTIRDFCQIIEREARDTLAVLKRNTAEIVGTYNIELPLTVRPQVRASGYVFKDMSLTLNQPRVTALLMGERLYAQPSVAVRELLQNAIDTCAARLDFEGDKYQPEILLTVNEDQVGRWIEVSDNGLGMDEHVLSEFFLKLGNSYYDSPEFGRLARQAAPKGRFVPISRFGIGIISVFIIGDVLEVYTKAANSPRGDSVARCLRIEKLGSLAFVTESTSGSSGTRVRVRLRPKYADPAGQFLSSLVNYIRSTVVRPRFPIHVRTPERSFVLTTAAGMRLQNNAKENLAKRSFELIMLDIGRWSDRFAGTVVILLARDSDGRLSHLQDDKYLRIGKPGVDPLTFLASFSGNRITVNGFAMSLKKASKILGAGKNRLAMVLDIDIRGDKDVQYDISRERIIGSGKVVVVDALEDAILRGLRDTGVFERLTPGSQRAVDRVRRVREEESRAIGFLGSGRSEQLRPGEPEEILDRVEPLLPKGDWPPGLHRSIAQTLSIPNGLAYRAISTLILRGRVTPPRDGQTLTPPQISPAHEAPSD